MKSNSVHAVFGGTPGRAIWGTRYKHESKESGSISYIYDTDDEAVLIIVALGQ